MAAQQRFSWSISLGRWPRIEVRLHLSLILLALVAGAVSLELESTLGFVLIGVLLVSLIAHEVAHAVVALKLGGRVDRVVLGPQGGLESPRVPDEPEPQVCVAMAGPITHLALVVVATGTLVYLGDRQILPLLNPGDPLASLAGDGFLLTCRALLWTNWLLFLLNWIPAYPFDGAPALRALLWPLVGRRSAAIVTSQVALTVAAALLVAGISLRMAAVETSSPIWITLVMLGLFVGVSAQRDLALSRWLGHESDELPADQTANSADDDWEQDESDHMVLVEQHHDQLRERYDLQRKAQEAYEDARVDDILARLHDEGIDHLSPEDQAFLKRASERYRNRRKDEKAT